MQLIVKIVLLLNLIILLNRIFQDVTNTENRIRNSLEINFSHFNFKNLNLGNFFRNISVVFFILLNNRPVDLISSLKNSLDIFLNVLNNALYFCFKISNGFINKSYGLLNLDSLVKNIIVTFVLLKFKRFINKLEVFIDFFDLFAIKFLRSDKVLLDFLFFIFNLIQ